MAAGLPENELPGQEQRAAELHVRLDELSPEESFELWTTYRDRGVNPIATEREKAAYEKIQRTKLYCLLAAIAGCLGLLLAAGSFFARRRKQSWQSNQE